MDNKSFEASGRIFIDNNGERFFLLVSASAQITLDGQIVPAGSLPATDPEFVTQLLEDFSVAFKPTPVGFSSDPATFSRFRIIRLIDESFEIVPADIQATLVGHGDSSRAVTVLGHVATDQEMGRHDQLTNPTVTLERVVAFESIQQRAFGIFESEESQSDIGNWLRAERELLGQ